MRIHLFCSGVTASSGEFSSHLFSPFSCSVVFGLVFGLVSEAASEASGARSAPAEPCDVLYFFLTQKDGERTFINDAEVKVR